MTSTAKPNPFVRITQQNHRLLKAIQKDDFDRFISLDPTQNQAVTLIHAANECIVRYPQGSFPLHVAYPMVYTTMHLIRACDQLVQVVKLYRRQAEEAKAKGRRAITFVAFNEAYHKRRQ